MIPQAPIDISVVVPVYNEAGNAGPLALEIAAAFTGQAAEIIFIDDASEYTPSQKTIVPKRTYMIFCR